MKHAFWVILIVCPLFFSSRSGAEGSPEPSIHSGGVVRFDTGQGVSPQRTNVHSASLVDPVSESGQKARGIYVTGPFFRYRGAQGVIRTARSAHADAVVIDLKDGQGRVTYDTHIAVLEPQQKLFLRDPAGAVKTLKEAGLYTIARVVCFSDPQLPLREPSRAILDNRPGRQGKPWVSWGTGNTWLDPYNRANHDLIVSLVQEVQAFGFDEIQLDYIRFPVDDGTPFAMYPAEESTPRRHVLLGLLRRIDEVLHIPLGADVFGLAAFHEGDTSGLGQDLALWAQHIEVFSPMLYLNAMRNWGHELERRAHDLVMTGVRRLRNRVGPTTVIRPFLQAFDRGADTYNEEFIAEQISGARSGGADGFLFWHPASNYGMLFRGMSGPARQLFPFPLDARMRHRKETWNAR